VKKHPGAVLGTIDGKGLPMAGASAAQRLSDFVALTKPRLNFLVVLTAGVGYYLGARESLDLLRMIEAVAGTALVAGGAAGLNQVYERDTDLVMWRTRTRPVAAGRLSAVEAAAFSLFIVLIGLAVLLETANPLAAGLALLTVVTYNVVYTPIKRHSQTATLIGAVPGALPPMIGWAAARGELNAGAWALFCIVFLWQIPHFMAIAWMYRSDFERARFPLSPVVAPDGKSTALQAVIFSALLIPASLAPWLLGMCGSVYAAGAVAGGLCMVALSVLFAMDRTDERARRLFFASITYLPLLWLLLVVGV
jgi:protoheme IX farnesyltransferase